MDDTTFGTIRLNENRYFVVPSVGYNNLASWANQKVSFGDYTRDSDDILSSKIWTQFVNGIGYDRIREGSDEGVCWYSNLWTRTPYQLTLNRRVDSVSGIKYPLGDLERNFFGATDTKVHPVDASTLAVGTALTNDLAGPPVNKGREFEGNQYIPLGTAGYAYHDGTTVTNSTAIDNVVDFIVWDATEPRMLGLCSDGGLHETFDGVSWNEVARLNSAYIPRKLVHYVDRQENEAVYIVHSKGVAAYDPVSDVLIPTRLVFPAHPDNGKGAAMWRIGEDLFISAGLGTYRYNLASISPVGLDRNSGIPAEFRGYITDFEPEHNALLAYVRGKPVVEESDPDIEIDPGQNSESIDMSDTQARTLLAAFTGFGWHVVWESADTTGEPNWVVVSEGDETYRIWWGYGVDADDRCYTQIVPRSFSNPKQLLEVGEGDFESTGYIDTGWFDANMQEFDKVADRFEVRLDAASTTEHVEVYYRTDFQTGWTLLGTANTVGRTTMYFGVDTTTDNKQFSYGIAFQRIRFRLVFNRGADPTLAPMLDSFVLKFRKLPLETATFDLMFPLDFEDCYGRAPWQVKQELDDLMSARTFVRLQLDSDPEAPSKRVSLSLVGGEDSTGDDYRGFRRVTVIGINAEGYDGNS